MRPGDTTLGGRGHAFPRTTWGLVAYLQDAATEHQRAGLETLCRTYWKPVYRYIRIAWAKGNEDAKDLTQAFLLWLLEGEALQRFRPEYGAFRSYLKVLLRRFVGHQETALKALKRGGGVKKIPIEGDPDFPESAPADPRAEDPEEAFERSWRIELVNRVLDRLGKRFASREKQGVFEMFKEHDLVPEKERPSYQALSEKHGLSMREVERHLYTVRKEFRSAVRAEVAETVSDPQALEEEWNALFGS
ncbi:MAG: RNA polymerase sigma factor [Planctomycetota bacterium]|jgi:RNA polymerase sigma-70 factor (ECF subfamily)